MPHTSRLHNRSLFWFKTITGLKEPQYKEIIRIAREVGMMYGRLLKLFPRADWDNELET